MMIDRNGILSKYSFNCPSFLNGMASVLDMGGHLNSYTGTTDKQAIESDWRAVCGDMLAAIKQLKSIYIKNGSIQESI